MPSTCTSSPVEHDGELVAAEARDHRLVRARGAAAAAHLAQQLVADVVAEGVVDLLEPVEVHEQHGRGAGGLQAPFEALLEVQPVGQPGQRVVQGQVLGLLGGAADPLDQRVVGQRDAGMAGEGLKQLGVFGVEGADVVEAVGDRQHADDRDRPRAAVRPSRRRGRCPGERRAPVAWRPRGRRSDARRRRRGRTTRPRRRPSSSAKIVARTGPQQVARLGDTVSRTDPCSSDWSADRVNAVEQLEAAVAQPLHVVAAVEQEAERAPSTPSRASAARLATQDQRSDQRQVGDDEGADGARREGAQEHARLSQWRCRRR